MVNPGKIATRNLLNFRRRAPPLYSVQKYHTACRCAAAAFTLNAKAPIRKSSISRVPLLQAEIECRPWKLSSIAAKNGLKP